jgi:mono/diheme cytochrome c family protein
MPAYGNTLSPQEVRALVAYLVSLRPPNTIPAQIPSVPLRTDRVSSGETTKETKAGG